jgi:hypothetical protein
MPLVNSRSTSAITSVAMAKASQPQQNQAERIGEQRADYHGEGPRQHYWDAACLHHGAGISAEAEEGGDSERGIASKTTDEIPRHRQRGVHHHDGRQP